MITSAYEYGTVDPIGVHGPSVTGRNPTLPDFSHNELPPSVHFAQDLSA
jgi:hypothetical protein